MIVEVAVLPPLALDPERKLCLVVDVLRAATSLAYMAEAGVGDVVIAPDPPAARSVARAIGPEALLAGESGGVRPDDFDLGNSPSAFLRPDLRGRPIVFCSSNGAKALHLLARAPAHLVGGFANATASASAALALGRERDLDVCIVCSGDHGFAHLSIEDLAGAGAIVERMAGQVGVALDESAEAARRVFRSYLDDAGGDQSAAAAAAIDASQAGRTLRSWGLADDLRDCARVDAIARAVAVRVQDGRLIAFSPMSGSAPSGAGATR